MTLQSLVSKSRRGRVEYIVLQRYQLLRSSSHESIAHTIASRPAFAFFNQAMLRVDYVRVRILQLHVSALLLDKHTRSIHTCRL